MTSCAARGICGPPAWKLVAVEGGTREGRALLCSLSSCLPLWWVCGPGSGRLAPHVWHIVHHKLVGWGMFV